MRNDFIKAFMWMYGKTKREAKEAYKTASQGYIQAVIYAWDRQAKMAFYND